MSKLPYLWHTRKYILGMPLSFTTYTLDPVQLTVKEGIVNLSQNTVKMFRVKDYSVSQPLIQRLFGCGYITLYTADATLPQFKLGPVPQPVKVAQLIDAAVENARAAGKVRTTEYMTNALYLED